MAWTDYGATIEGKKRTFFSLAQGESQGSGENLAEKIRVAVAAGRARSAAPVHTAMRAQLMMSTAVMTSAPVSPAHLNRRSALSHWLVERAAYSSRINSS